MASHPLDICGIDECKQRPYPCKHTWENCIDSDFSRSGTASCWADECRLDAGGGACSAGGVCFDPDVFVHGSKLECRDDYADRPWGTRPEYAGCKLEHWRVIAPLKAQGKMRFQTSGLGRMSTPDVSTWVCVEGHECAGGAVAGAPSSHFCFVYHDKTERFIPWGTALETKLVHNTTRCSVA
eukprot:CAMPEP_0172017522 /NCGR_PEP_ID=MMETSP1041-20130122/11608_1 /TAXON_ID=464988 /ORGANISM="Hemiselmis andersenii, Strain CCMP439" /LENGTH=181 /DNA_ID=CAMNT_0012672555 /DNA_START=14 /DNA_END=556 /DNA_ORIENTATION=+